MAGNEKWVIAIHNSDEGTTLRGAYGSADDIISIINEMIAAAEENFPETFKDCEDAGVVDDGSICGCAGFADCHIDYTARRADELFETTFVAEYADHVINSLRLRLETFDDRYTENEKTAINRAVRKLEYIRQMFGKGRITVDEAVAEIRRAAHE